MFSFQDFSQLRRYSEENELAIQIENTNATSSKQFIFSAPTSATTSKVPESLTVQTRKRPPSKMQPLNKTSTQRSPTRVERSAAQLQRVPERTATDFEDQYDKFVNHMASQLRQLPLRSFIVLQGQIQQLITSERLNIVDASTTARHQETQHYSDDSISPPAFISDEGSDSNEDILDGFIQRNARQIFRPAKIS